MLPIRGGAEQLGVGRTSLWNRFHFLKTDGDGGAGKRGFHSRVPSFLIPGFLVAGRPPPMLLAGGGTRQSNFYRSGRKLLQPPVFSTLALQIGDM